MLFAAIAFSAGTAFGAFWCAFHRRKDRQ